MKYLFLPFLLILILFYYIKSIDIEKFNNNTKNQNIIVHCPPFDEKSGGCIVLYYLAYLIKHHFPTLNVYIYDRENKKRNNRIYSNYIENSKIPKHNITIYPEVIKGNPLKSPKCIRYILCELGKHCSKDIYTTWNKEDLIFHHSSFNTKNNDKINPFSIIYINPIFKDLGLKRTKTSFTIRKAHKFYTKIEILHPKESIEIKSQNHDELLKIFNKCTYFYCYDPYSGLSNIALLCGCIPIIPKLDGVSEKDYLKSRSYSQYENIIKLPGYAYGIENIEYAKKTLQEGQSLILKQNNRNRSTIKQFVNNILNPNYKENNEKYYYMSKIMIK